MTGGRARLRRLKRIGAARELMQRIEAAALARSQARLADAVAARDHALAVIAGERPAAADALDLAAAQAGRAFRQAAADGAVVARQEAAARDASALAKAATRLIAARRAELDAQAARRELLELIDRLAAAGDGSAGQG
jgi:hypothetical protein